MFSFAFPSCAPRILSCAFTSMVSLAVVQLLAAAQISRAQPRPVSHLRINELAASLLRAHRTLIEEPGLRHDGERLEAYMDRIAAPLPGESDARHIAREERYVAALVRAGAPENICAAPPALLDNGPRNTAIWLKAVHASGVLPGCVARAREAWAACRRSGVSRAKTHRLGRELALTVHVIRSAYDALREARP